MSSITIPILLMRKPKLKESEELAQDHTAVSGRVWILI